MFTVVFFHGTGALLEVIASVYVTPLPPFIENAVVWEKA